MSENQPVDNNPEEPSESADGMLLEGQPQQSWTQRTLPSWMQSLRRARDPVATSLGAVAEPREVVDPALAVAGPREVVDPALVAEPVARGVADPALAAPPRLFDNGNIIVDGNRRGKITNDNILKVMDALNNVNTQNSNIVDNMINSFTDINSLLDSMARTIKLLTLQIRRLSTDLDDKERKELDTELKTVRGDFKLIEEIKKKVEKHEETSDILTQKIISLLGRIKSLKARLQAAGSPPTVESSEESLAGVTPARASMSAGGGGRKNKRKITKKVISKKSLSKKKLSKKKKNKAKKVTKKKKSGRKINKSYFKKNIYF